MLSFLEVAERAARSAGETLLDWAGRFEVREKGPRDLVTQADLASQTVLKTVILGHFPDHAFIGEEDPRPIDPAQRYCWIVDPLDGTTNFVHGVPHYAVSVALLEQGRPLVGVIHDPVSGDCYRAERGSGAYWNGKRMRTSGQKDLGKALVAASFAAKVDPADPEIAQFNAAVLSTQGVRRTGSAALNLAYVASGRFDAFWALSTKAWDVAAGVLLVEEAGGQVSGWRGEAFDLNDPHPVASASAELQAAFLEMLAGAGAPRG